MKLFVIAVEKTTAGRLQQLQRGGRLVGLNVDFNLRRDHKNIFYERRDYESVDEKSLS